MSVFLMDLEIIQLPETLILHTYWILPYSEVAEVQETLLGDSKDVLGPSTVVANSDESQLLTPGKMSQRQGKEAYPVPTRDSYQPSFSPASPHSQAVRRQKEA
nr:PREDICTED: oxysterol-binding protein-related protein 8-like [Equus przewalskii]